MIANISRDFLKRKAFNDYSCNASRETEVEEIFVNKIVI